MQCINIIVHGFVQGVFFRSHIKIAASNLGLKGYVKNLSDGTVELVAEGPKEKLNELIEFCKKGPEVSQVKKVDVKFTKANNEFESFEIRY